MFLFFGVLSGVLSFIGYPPYIRDMLKGETRPERASWFLWIVLGLIAFSTQYVEGATYSLVLPFAHVVIMTIVFLLSFRYGIGGFSKRDRIGLLVAGIGLILWFITDKASIALFSSILIGAIGGVLTSVKSFYNPDTESLFLWVVSALSGLCALLSLEQASGILLAYPIYFLINNATIACAILAGRKRKASAD